MLSSFLLLLLFFNYDEISFIIRVVTVLQRLHQFLELSRLLSSDSKVTLFLHMYIYTFFNLDKTNYQIRRYFRNKLAINNFSRIVFLSSSSVYEIDILKVIVRYYIFYLNKINQIIIIDVIYEL